MIHFLNIVSYKLKTIGGIMKNINSTLSALTKSAAILLSRQLSNKLEILLLKRKPNISFGSVWVSPGGVCEPLDKIFPDFIDYGKITALRETYEETGLLIVPQDYDVNVDTLSQKEQDIQRELLKIWSRTKLNQCIFPVLRLLTIQVPNKRFDTLFYLLNHNTKVINLKLYKQTKLKSNISNLDDLKFNGQSVSYQWNHPLQFIQKGVEGSISLMPPQLLILGSFANAGTLDKLRQEAGKMRVQPVMMQRSKEGIFMLPSDQQYNVDKILELEPESESKKQIEDLYRKRQRKSLNRFTLHPKHGFKDFRLEDHPYDLIRLSMNFPKM